MKTKNPAPFDLDEALKEVEQIVLAMEKNTSDINEGLAKFEMGIKTIRQCQKALKEAEQKVKMLVEKNGETVLTEYDTDNTEEKSKAKQAILDVDDSAF